MDTPAVFPAWPGDADVAVALTFDVDGEAAWLGEGPQNGRRLTLLSQSRFGPGRGLARIPDLLAEFDLRATFYVPGHAADHHPDTITAILAGGHEVGHHGYLHLSTGVWGCSTMPGRLTASTGTKDPGASMRACSYHASPEGARLASCV